MKDYTRFIQTKDKYIKNYEITNDRIIVNTIRDKKTKQNTYSITSSKIKDCEQKLINQYHELIHKQGAILQYKIDIKQAICFITAMLLCIAGAITSDFSDALGMIIAGSGALTIFINAIENYIYTKKFTFKIKMYQDYLKKRAVLEKAISQDKINITLLSSKSQEKIRNNIKLKDEKLIDKVFNIDFMDKATLKDLKILLYQINTNNNTEAKVKKKTRKPENHSRKGIHHE